MSIRWILRCIILLGLNLKYADTYNVLPNTDDIDDDKYYLYLLRHFTSIKWGTIVSALLS